MNHILVIPPVIHVIKFHVNIVMTSVSSSFNGVNKPIKPWFCTSERLRWEFFSKGQKRTFRSRAVEISNPQETYRRIEGLTTARNKKTIKATKMGRRITRRRKNQNTKTEVNKTNTVKMQIDNDEQYVELENIQLEEDHIMEEEETKEAPESDTKKLKDENNSEEELQHSEENIEPVKSEDDEDIGEEEQGIAVRKFTRSTRRARVIIPPKKPQTRKSQRKSTKGSTKDWVAECEFKGRDIVFVDPLDDKAEFWWPAMIVPHDEIDESMDVDGKLEENILAGKYLVRYFEDMTYSIVENKGLKHFIPGEEPYLTFKNNSDNFINHIGVRRALTCKSKGEPNKAFKWDYWRRPLWDNQRSISAKTISTKRTRSTSKGGSKSEKKKSSVRRYSSSTKSRSSINSENHSSQEVEEEDTANICTASPPTSNRGRKSETDQDSQDSQSNSGTTKDNTEMESVEINKSPKRRRSNLTDKSDEVEEGSFLRNRKSRRVSASKSMVEEPSVPSNATPNTPPSATVETLTEISTEPVIETSTENNNEQAIIETSMEENYEQAIIETSTEKNIDLTIIEVSTEKCNEPTLIEASTEDNNESIIIEASTEKRNEPLIEIMEEDNVPSATPLTSPPLTIEELNEAALVDINSFNFDDPTLDAEAKEKMYDDAEEKLRSLMKEWRAINRNLRKIEKELIAKKARKLRNNEELGDGDIDTDDEEDTENVDLVDSSDNENNNEGEEREDEEEIQVITRSRKVNEDFKVSKDITILL
ncbi:hypothetical protein GLOIN_2v1762582 [Rhizophagus clarus]|uniref:PWWP domain-containing protein n=1 Tax=Rhizophagus clarus TaxID=94130 RepID=A0A8H3L886_9GLOM|nr:hypothetical protein GLOIN_2v1762582 [Rhizophagus clarus]